MWWGSIAEGLGFLFGQAEVFLLFSTGSWLFLQTNEVDEDASFRFLSEASLDRDPTASTNFMQLGFSSNIPLQDNFCGGLYFDSLVVKIFERPVQWQ